MPDTATTSSLRGRVLDAYGGAERWRAATAVEVEYDAGGMLLRMKRGRAVGAWRNMHVRAELHEPRIRMGPFDRDGNFAVLEGHDVRLETADGDVVEARPAARDPFPNGGGRWLRWDALDGIYFLAQATWNYLTLPGLLLREDIDWRELSETTLEAQFPPHLPTHALKQPQQYHFDPETHLLAQYDYVAEVVGEWAVAGHVILEHAIADGIPYPSRRRVRTRTPGGKLMPVVLIWLDVRRHRLVGAK